MFLPIAFLLGCLWLMALVSGLTFGGVVHVLPVAVAIMTIFGLRQWRRRPA